MKPEGRALDIAVVGLGQAGGNIASEFSRRGYRALALNTAETDLAALGPGGVFPQLPVERRVYIGIAGYDGAGADPGYGAECVSEHAQKIRAAILELASEADVLILAAGLGGGTGSALAALVEVMKGANLPMVAMMTIPTAGESGIVKVNAVRAIGELLEAPLLGWIFIDNARITELRNDLSVSNYFTRVNRDIVSPLDALNLLNDRESLKAIRSFDGEDFRRLILSGGFLNYAVTELHDVTTEAVMAAIRTAIDSSTLMPGGFEMARLSCVGVVIEAPEVTLSKTSINVFEQIQERLKAETKGAAVYQGIYRASDGEPNVLRLIAATQALPKKVVELVSTARREGSALSEKVREEMPMLDLSDVEGMELFRTSPPNRPSERPRRSSLLPQPAMDTFEDEGTLGAPPPGLANGGSEPNASGAPPRGLANGGSEPNASGEPPQEEERRQDSSPSFGNRPVDQRLLRRRLNRPRESGAPARSGSDRDRARAGRGAASDDEDHEEERSLAAGVVPDELLGIGHPTQTNIQLRRELLEKAQRKEQPQPVSGEEYARIVDDYLSAKTPREKDEIIQRLQADSLADDKMTRYYAVEAMARLGRGIFAAALLAATEDDDEKVRTLAKDALRR